MVQSLVRNHFGKKQVNETRDDAAQAYDIVCNKGQGLIILLHGAPLGPGKLLLQSVLYNQTTGHF